MGISDDIKKRQDKAAMLTRSLELQVKMYPEKTHFIYELLQNAEDAGASVVSFAQYADRLEMYHDGKPFTESNVQSLCDAANSDKSGKIGKFGIGFKSVFTICRTVELYSEPNNRLIDDSLPRFAIKIENYTDPNDIGHNWRLEKPYTTKFVFHFIWGNYYKSIEELRKDVATKLHKLGISVLLFLSNIKEIQYNISGVYKEMDSNGLYMLDKVELTTDYPSTKNKYYKVTAVGNKDELDISYLLFSRPLENINRTVDIAFAMTEENKKFVFQRLISNYVSVYFPTQMESKLDFLIQAPFDVIPTRNSLEENSDNNTEYITVLSELLRDSVIEISKNKWLSLDFLNLLPFSMPDEDFPFKLLYVNLYDKTLELFENEKILPVIDNDNICISKKNAKLARGGVREGGIVEMFPNDKLALLVGTESKWMPTKTDNNNFTDGDDNLGRLYNFLKKKIGVAEIGNEEIPVLLRDNPNFIKSFVDDEEWLMNFYNYLVQKCRADLGKKQRYAQIPFIKTTKGEFKSAHKIIGQEQAPNIYRKSKSVLRELESLNFTAEFIQEKCIEFLELMNIPEPDEYDYFKKELEDIYNDDKIDEKQNIEQFKKSIKFLKDNRENVKGLLKTYLWLKCTKANGEELWTTCNSIIFFNIDLNKVSLFDYFIGTETDVYILNDDYYIKKGINIESLRLLKEIGVRDSDSVITKGSDWWNENGLSSGNYGNFKRNLDFNYINNVLLYIHTNSNLEISKRKSGSLFALLKTVENNLRGKWRHGAQSPVYKNDVSEIIKKLNGTSYIWVNNNIIYTKDLKWIYSKDGQIVLPSEITRFDLDLSIYGEIDTDSEIYDILGFKQTEQEKDDELLSDFNSQYSDEEKSIILKQLLADKQYIEELQAEDEEFDPDIDIEERAFPEEKIQDLTRLREQTEANYLKAPNVKYEPVVRRIRTSRGDDRAHLRNRYEGFCQICETPSSFWEVAEIFNKPIKEMEELNLSLCPNCASLYRQKRNDTSLMMLFADKLRSVKVNNETTVPIDSVHHIRFTQAHLAEIQVILNLDKTIPSQDEEEAI
jgi:hypothetical protein